MVCLDCLHINHSDKMQLLFRRIPLLLSLTCLFQGLEAMVKPFSIFGTNTYDFVWQLSSSPCAVHIHTHPHDHAENIFIFLVWLYGPHVAYYACSLHWLHELHTYSKQTEAELTSSLAHYSVIKSTVFLFLTLSAAKYFNVHFFQ